jgi:hypothetical protein
MANVHIDIRIRHYPQPVPITMQQPRCPLNLTLQRYLALYQHLNHEPQTWPQVFEEKGMTTSGFVLMDTWGVF